MTRAGFVALLGFPNAGKSTLFNRLVGERLAAITPKPQTTRFNISAVLTHENIQYAFVDTPGWISQPKNIWHKALTHQSLSAARDADVQVWVLSLQQRMESLPDSVEAFLLKAPALVAAFTHGDLLAPDERATRIAILQQELARFPFKGWIDVSTDRSLDDFLTLVGNLLPESPFLYPTDILTTLPTRFFVAEILREVLFMYLREELPYGTEVEIIQYKEGEHQDYIAATIYVEKDSHKPIVIGQGGKMLKKIGMTARQQIEKFIQKPVYLELYVKVAPHWRRSVHRLHSLGYKTP